LVWVRDQEDNPSIVWEDVVAIVSVDELELEFFIQYILPWQEVASGRVRVVAEVPPKTSVLSVAPAVVALVKAVYFAESDPLTSRVELGDVVPIPI
jgi:hypothetical protein